MSAREVIAELDRLPAAEQKEVFVFLAQKFVPESSTNPKQWVGRKMNFEEACDLVFRENRELLSRLAK